MKGFPTKTCSRTSKPFGEHWRNNPGGMIRAHPCQRLVQAPTAVDLGLGGKRSKPLVDYVNGETPLDETERTEQAVNQPNGTGLSTATQAIPKTPRSPSWKLQFLVMRRDGFKCQFCGAAPATTPGVELDLDHRGPWGKGGETIFENLQTLC